MIARTGARLGSALAVIARPLLVVTGALLSAGALVAASGVSAGWPLYLAGFALITVTLPALAAAHRGRLGRPGLLVIGLATVIVALAVPVVAMVTTFSLGMDQAHQALMPYVLTPVGMGAAYAVNVVLALVGLVIARSGVRPALAGWLIVVAALVEWPVELGLLPLPVWALAMIVFATALLLIARALPQAPRMVQGRVASGRA
jgi:hypothetical protein